MLGNRWTIADFFQVNVANQISRRIPGKWAEILFIGQKGEYQMHSRLVNGIHTHTHKLRLRWSNLGNHNLPSWQAIKPAGRKCFPDIIETLFFSQNPTPTPAVWKWIWVVILEIYTPRSYSTNSKGWKQDSPPASGLRPRLARSARGMHRPAL